MLKKNPERRFSWLYINSSIFAGFGSKLQSETCTAPFGNQSVMQKWLYIVEYQVTVSRSTKPVFKITLEKGWKSTCILDQVRYFHKISKCKCVPKPLRNFCTWFDAQDRRCSNMEIYGLCKRKLAYFWRLWHRYYMRSYILLACSYIDYTAQIILVWPAKRAATGTE